jgi:hypothetical protein
VPCTDFNNKTSKYPIKKVGSGVVRLVETWDAMNWDISEKTVINASLIIWYSKNDKTSKYYKRDTQDRK